MDAFISRALFLNYHRTNRNDDGSLILLSKWPFASSNFLEISSDALIGKLELPLSAYNGENTDF